METLIEGFKSAVALDVGIFVHIATLGYVLGFLFKNQLTLRLLVLVATVSYIVYYYAFPAEPLWGAIFGSVLIMIANITGTIRLLFDRLPLKIPPEQRPIFKSLKGLEPGEFRALMKIGRLEKAATDTLLTSENLPPENLYYVVDGVSRATKGENTFEIPPGRFIGEVSFVLDQSASATVTLPAGGSYVSWNRDNLKNILSKHPKLQQAFEALIGRDMAAKVAFSQPKHQTLATPQVNV